MDRACYIDRLIASAERIARHANYPGKEQAVELCLEDIEELASEGRISSEERVVLRRILREPTPCAA